MPLLPVASATLVANLTASLADNSHRWRVLGVNESRKRSPFWLFSAGAYSVVTNVAGSGGGGGSVSGGNGSIAADNPVGSSNTLVTTLNGTSVTNADWYTAEIKLIGTKVRLAAGLVPQIELDYFSVWAGLEGQADTFNYGVLRFNDGAAYRHTNAALDTALRAKATALMTDRLSPLESTLNNGPGNLDPIAMPDTLLAAIKVSIANPLAAWRVYSTMASVDPINKLRTYVAQIGTPKVMAALDTNRPASFTYTARVNAIGDLIDVTIHASGAAWRTFDTDLFNTLQALIATYRSDTATDFEAALEAFEA